MCHTGLPLAQDNHFMDILALWCGPGGTEQPSVVDAACWAYQGFILMEIEKRNRNFWCIWSPETEDPGSVCSCKL